MSGHRLSVLIVSKGHVFAHDAFLAMFADMRDIATTLVEQPAAQAVLASDAERWDCVLFYDMSGIPGIGLTHDDASARGEPAPE